MADFAEVHRLFEEGRGLDPAARDAFLREIGDAELRREVAGLLQSEVAMGEAGFLTVRTQSPAEGLPAPGSSFGPFEIVRELGRGGMGAVFLAVSADGERQVALKILHPLLWTTEESRQELMHEAGMVRRLQHEAVVPLLDQIEVAGWTALVYEYIDGESLAAEIQRFHRGAGDGRWHSREDAIRELLPVLDALASAHAEGIWHRDVKPSNILLAHGGHAYLTDLGLAKDAVDPDVTRSGVFKGSVRYMSPEQARARLRLVDHRSDIFSAALVLFEAISGEHAFARGEDEGEILERIAHGEARLLDEAWPEAPEPLSAICYRALRPAREDRYGSIERMASDLRAFLEARPVSVRLPGWRDRMRARLGRHRARVAILSLVVLVALLTVAVVTLGPQQPTAAIFVDSSAPGHEVLVQEHDATTGEYGPARLLGETPLSSELPAGAYRFTVVAPDRAFAEIHRIVHVDRDLPRLEILARPLRTEQVQAGMVRIEAGNFLAGDRLHGEGTAYPFRQETIAADYLVDRHEVTNAEYAEYLEATGRPGPPHFAQLDLATAGQLPVVRVTWREAADYAEWRGKRLPTNDEWERAARGRDGRRQPWGDPPSDQTLVAQWSCVGRASLEEFSDPSIAPYLRHAAPVGTHPRDLSPDGVSDMGGNVSEFVEDRPAVRNGGVVRIGEGQRMFRGSSWKLPAIGLSLTMDGTVPAGDDSRNVGIGFRCARSVLPVTEDP